MANAVHGRGQDRRIGGKFRSLLQVGLESRPVLLAELRLPSDGLQARAAGTGRRVPQGHRRCTGLGSDPEGDRASAAESDRAHSEGVVPLADDLGLDGACARREVIRALGGPERSEEHTSELQSLMRISYAVFCLKKKKNNKKKYTYNGHRSLSNHNT